MQQIIKNGQLVEDSWQLIDQETTLEKLPVTGAIIVPMALWQAEAATLKERADAVGIWLDSDQEIEHLEVDTLGELPLIALNFPSFNDGRHYSTARLLRERFAYGGEIRAIGDILQDQLFYLHRCGFDAFVVRADQDLAKALAGLHDFSVCYQGAADIAEPLFRRR